jgi:putative hydrolase of the HAD superfamily
MNKPILLLFDLGGVLVENRTFQRLRRLVPESLDRDTLKDRWLRSSAVRQFELGQSAPEAFAADFIMEWGISLSADDFLAELAAWPVGFYPQARNLLHRFREKYRVGCLSNANTIHWERFSGFKAEFDIAISSHLLGAIKLDPEAFLRTLRLCGTSPQEVCFFYDAPANVEAAIDVGLRAFHVDGFDALRKTLRREGYL